MNDQKQEEQKLENPDSNFESCLEFHVSNNSSQSQQSDKFQQTKQFERTWVDSRKKYLKWDTRKQIDPKSITTDVVSCNGSGRHNF